MSDADGQEYTLAGLQFYNLSQFPAPKRTMLEKAIGKMIVSFFDRPKIQVVKPKLRADRYGRIAIYLYSNAELRHLLQLELVVSGLALVRPDDFGKNYLSCFAELSRAEKKAENNQAGIWYDKNMVIMPSNDRNWPAKTDAYRIVEGVVLSVGQTGSRFYLNFGRDWQSDFTVIVAKRIAKRFNRTVGGMESLAGKKIRIRGWMHSDRGPMIEVYHPGQIELIVE